MRFTATDLEGAYLVDLERIEDDRGFFARAWCEREFAEHGLDATVVQCNLSFNHRRGTVRGMHYQAAPHQEVKLVRCIRGAIYDVIVDLRPDSATYGRWLGVELDQRNRRMLYVPKGFAHGYQTLEDETEVFYQVSEPYHPGSERGVRWNDPAIAIAWPVPVTEISSKDRGLPDMASIVE